MHQFCKLLLVLSFIFFSCKKSSILLDEKKLNDIINKYVSNDFYPFLHVRIENENGEVTYEHSSINRSAHPDLDVDGNSLIRIWSMSKIVTISIVMNLVENGLLKLDDPVEKFIPEFKNLKVAQSQDGRSLSEFAAGSIFEGPLDDRIELACPSELVNNDSVMMVKHLIDHTAGFYYANTKIECLDMPIINKDLVMAENSDSLISLLSRLPLIHHPGERYHYGLNTTVLGLVAERATNLSLEELVHEKITGPGGFEDLKFKLNDGDTLIEAMTFRDGYFREPLKGEMDILGRNTPNYDKNQKLYFGGAGLIASSNAYADYLRFWLNDGKLGNERFLKESTISSMVNSVRKKSGYGTDTDFFFFITGDSTLSQGKGDKGLWEGGGYEGTTFWIDHERGFVVVIMTQVWWPKEGAYQFRDEFRGELYRQIFDYENKPFPNL